MGSTFDRSRATGSVVMLIIGAVLLIAGTVALYAREQIVDREAFANRAVAALDDDGVRTVVGREIVVYLAERGSADLAAARPLLESVVGTLIQTDPFQRVFRSAAGEANRVFFVRDKENVLLDLGDASDIVRFGLRSVSPNLARQLPSDLKPDLLALKDSEVTGTTLRAADNVRTLGIVLPLLALLLLVGAVALAVDRRVAVLRVGVAIGAAGTILLVGLLVLQARTLAGVYGEDEVTDEEVRNAVGGLFDAFLGDLLTWALLLALLGIALAAAAAALDPEDVEARAQRLRRLAQRPKAGWARALRGAAALLAGVLAVLEPTLAVQIVAVLGGAFLVFLGMSELLLLLARPGQTRAEAERTRGRAFVAAGAAGVLVVGALTALVIVVTSSAPEPSVAQPSVQRGQCNGSFALCELRLNEAAWAGTHNSFSASDSPGWFIANQRHGMQRQLKDGIRLFLIDPHWGIENADGRVRTDFATEKRDRNKVAKSLPPKVLASAERLAGRLGAGGLEGKPDVWLCHTVCELGATKMVDSMVGVREFLEANRGEVVILFIEPYVSPQDIENVFRESGLLRYVETLDRDSPMPTLGELVSSNKRVIVLTEKDADGTVPWYLDGFSFVQDTPLGVTKVKQLSCDLERGDVDSPFLMINHWADVFPPRSSPNEPFQTEKAIVGRAKECQRKRGVPVSLIAVDHYELGSLIPAVDALNAERIQRLRRAQAATRGG
jgi:uncharacterized membrane protein HdeD (DUF308 family)